MSSIVNADPPGPARGDPAVDVRLAAVVGGQRQHLVAVVLVEQVAQVVAAVGDVDLRRREVRVVNVVAPDRWARNSAVWGRICISPTAPAEEVRGSNFVSA